MAFLDSYASGTEVFRKAIIQNALNIPETNLKNFISANGRVLRFVYYGFRDRNVLLKTSQ